VSKGKLRRKREHRKAGQKQWERTRVGGESGDDARKDTSRSLLPEGVLRFPQGGTNDRDLLYGLLPMKPRKDRDVETAQLLRGILAHREALMEKDPWLPFPQHSCSFTFGKDKAPLPVGALALLWERWPAATGKCSDCGGHVLATAFGGGLSQGGVSACCSNCGRVHFRCIGGLSAVGEAPGRILKGTGFYVATGIFGGAQAGPRRPLWDALRELGVSELPEEEWATK